MGLPPAVAKIGTMAIAATASYGTRDYAQIAGINQTQSANEALGVTYTRSFLTNQFYQYAINFGAKYYSFSSGTYDPSLAESIFGTTSMIDGSIKFGKTAMASPTTLAATGWHETVHQDQFFQGKHREVGPYALEVQAGVDTLFHAPKMNLSPKDYDDEANYLRENMSKR